MQANKYRDFLDVAIKASHEAGALLRQKFGTSLHIDKKGRINVVTEADLAAEKLIREIISFHFPNHDFLGEESGIISRSNAPLWIVDPLDGTTNFAQGYPFFSVSIALEINKEIVVGVVYAPISDETFHACKGEGAYLNGKPIHVSNHNVLEESLLVTGFPYDVSRDPDLLLSLFREMVIRARGIRRDGSAALDLCYVASGRFDAFWEVGLHPWDMAAGSLLVREAGGRMTNFNNDIHQLSFRDMLASNTLLHEDIMSIIKPFSQRLYKSEYWRGIEF